MVKIADQEGSPWDHGRDKLFEVAAARIDIDEIFENPDLVYRLIEFSGGSIRDLMHLLLLSADATATEAKINGEAASQAIRKLTRIYDRLIHEEDLPILLAIAQDPYHPYSSGLARLMFNRLVLPYINETNWRALHPATLAAPTYQTYERRSSDIQVSE